MSGGDGVTHSANGDYGSATYWINEDNTEVRGNEEVLKLQEDCRGIEKWRT